MKELFEFRVNNDHYHLLSKPNNGKDNGMVHVVRLSKEDPNFEQIRLLSKKYQDFFFGWQIKREYSKRELDTATLFQMKIKTTFEPAGEECGTLYDENIACEICGANRKQIGALKLKKSSIPKKDIARTIAGEIVVSDRFKEASEQLGLKGLELLPIEMATGTSNYYQLVALTEIELSQSTLAGINVFDLTNNSEGEIYKCPKNHTIGLNLLSEAYVINSQSISEYDYFASKQKVGVKRGLLRPEPIYFCSPAFRKMVVEEKLSGFEFEIANVE